MPLLERKRAMLLCLSTLFVASVGFSVSVLATILSLFASTYFWSESPPTLSYIQVRNTASSPKTTGERVLVAASIPSSSPPTNTHPKPKPHPDARPRSRSPAHDTQRVQPPSEPLRVQSDAETTSGVVFVQSIPCRSRQHRTPSPSPFRSPRRRATMTGLEPDAKVQPEVTLPIVPSIAVSAPATKLLFEEPIIESPIRESTSTSSDTLISAEAEAVPSAEAEAVPAPVETIDAEGSQRGRKRHRLRLSKLVQLFGGDKDKEKKRERSSNKRKPFNRHHSLPPSPKEILGVPLVASPEAEPLAFLSEEPKTRQTHRKRKSRSLILRVASCPIIHHSGRASTDYAASFTPTDLPPLPQSPLLSPPLPTAFSSPSSSARSLPTSPSSSPLSQTSPLPTEPAPDPSSRKHPKSKKSKDVAPRPRTQPYAAPYFIPPPDTEGIEEPLSLSTVSRERKERRNPSRRRTMPPPPITPTASTIPKTPERRLSALALEVVSAADLGMEGT